MTLSIPFPVEKISWFKEKLGIGTNDFNQIGEYRHLFINNKSNFSIYFFDYFSRIVETDFFLKHQEHGENLSRIWENWFASFFKNNFDNSFLMSLWRSGLRHVELNIDHRFITLSYSILRQFCQDIVKNEIPEDTHKEVLVIIDKMVDLCTLVETHAFIEATSRCDMEVVRGISHQVRNPLTVIGGNAMRLMSNASKDTDPDNIHNICKTIIEESTRLEKMVTDAAIYSDMFEKETEYSGISLNTLISESAESLNGRLKITDNLPSEDIMIQGDYNDLKILFANVFGHCIETAGKKQTDILISIDHFEPSAPFVEIEIVNRGFYALPEEIQNAFVPFYSSRPEGTGFGLSIARLAARKNLGDIYLENLQDKGMVYFLKLPALVKA
jgi:signal transduction histidine kinase